MKKRERVMGIDVGSTGVKAALLDDSLKEPLASATVHYVAHQPVDGISEHSGELLLKATIQAMRELHAQMQGEERVAAIAVCAMMSGAIPVDASGQALAPYTTTLDRRSDAWLLAASQAHGAQILRLTGSTQPVMAAKIAWLREHLAGSFQQVAKILPAGPFVAGHLAGLAAAEAFVDPTYLWMTGLADVQRNTWSAELAELLDIDKALLPQIRPSTDIVGGLTRALAQATGLSEGIPIVAGCGDQLAGYLGAGITQTGSAADVAGTYAVFAVASETFAPESAQRFECVRAASPGLWYTQSLLAGTGLNNGWFGTSIVSGRGLDEGLSHTQLLHEVERSAQTLPAGADGLVFVPHLGGQALPLLPTLRGAWLGLHWQHRREHLYRALLESVAIEHHLSLRERAQHAGYRAPAEVITYGGGADSALWCQIKADVLGIPYRRLALSDPAARGCALLAAHAAGWINDLAAASAPPALYEGSATLPDAAKHSAYLPLAQRYEQLVQGLAALGAVA